MAILAPVVFSILSVVVRLSAHRSQIRIVPGLVPQARKRREGPHHAERASFPTLTIPESIAPPIGTNYPNCAVHKKESLFVLYSALPESQWWMYSNRTQPDYCPPAARHYRGSSPDPAIRLQAYLDPLWAGYKCDAGLCLLWEHNNFGLNSSSANASANNSSDDVLTLNRSIHVLEERLRNTSHRHYGDSGSQYDPVLYDDYTKDQSPRKCNWLLPMDDRVIYLLSKNRQVLQRWGWRVASLDTEPAVIARLQHKALWGADAVTRGLGHFVPKLYRSNSEAKFPCLLKHGSGSAGMGITRIKDLKQLRRVLDSTTGKKEFEPNKDYVLQEVVS